MTDPSREALAATTRAWVALWSAPFDRPAFDRLHDERFVDRSSAGRPSDRAGFAAGIERFLQAFPDVRTEALELVIDAPRGRVAVRWMARGTNRQCYLGVGPTGRMTTITGIEIVEIEHGRVMQRWGEWDITDHTSPTIV